MKQDSDLTPNELQIILAALSAVQIGGTGKDAENIIATAHLVKSASAKVAAMLQAAADE